MLALVAVALAARGGAPVAAPVPGVALLGKVVEALSALTAARGRGGAGAGWQRQEFVMQQRGARAGWQRQEMILDQRAVDFYAEICLYGAVGGILFFAAVLLGCCVYDALMHWRHLAYFRSCKSQVERLQHMFQRPNQEMSLCPICISPVSSSSVVFLCGHRFHTECTNTWYRTKTTKEGCPICTVCETEGLPSESGEVEEASAVACYHDGEAKAFFLRSLSERFPEFITKECVPRWTSCRTEIWLSELECPRYRSIFKLWRGEEGAKAGPFPAAAAEQDAVPQDVAVAQPVGWR